MSSVTGEFSSLTKSTTQNSSYSRNALSTVKKKCQRRKINIMPLSLAEIKKEFEESESDPLWMQPNSAETNKENQGPDLQSSFELNFAALSLTTPAKQPVKNGDFATPQTTSTQLLPHKTNRMLDFQYATPNNKIPPKVQCSVNMQTYLKAPLNKLVEEKCEDDCSSEARVKCSLNLSFKKIKVNNLEYIVLNELGKGGSSEVFHCYDPQGKSHRAVKCVSLENKVSANGFINEVQMLKRLQKCNRIIKMFDFEIKQEDKLLLVVLEVGGADLAKILKESALSTNHMPLYMLLYYWMEMLYAVKQIHSHGIIHSDLKPANFLEVEGYLKLIDFGIATCIQNDMTSVIKAVPEGSFNYISPEALNNEETSSANSPSYGKPKYKISYKSDVWSLGCILYQLVYRRTPFQHITQIWMKLAAILDPNHKIEYPNVDWVPQKIIETIKRCLQSNVKLRPSIDELITEYEGIFQNI